ncbi:MAG: hypothetical protein HYR62_05840 [Actinobacteria bacterium]|nr:hypothetical protein [Actinomycetota bacterium]MBI3687949.1 hypothetical protein [Actinomycetota bacterium]
MQAGDATYPSDRSPHEQADHVYVAQQQADDASADHQQDHDPPAPAAQHHGWFMIDL